MRLRNCLNVLILSLNLSIPILGEGTSGSLQAPEVIYAETSVDWPVSAPDRGLLLTVSGPGRLYLQREYPAGSWAPARRRLGGSWRGYGVNLGEFQMKLLEKIEELTLYTLEQAKVIDRQAGQIASKNQEVEALKARMEVLEQVVKQLLTERK
ncbi:MAG: hypothetical protein EHM61_10015 [Acidobacteria bacterium]|nr:MAG: hypothetical protein EHM61_10015 [Acidobacteriota bacterium]